MTLDGDWIRYDARPRERLFERVHVTINRKGQIHLSRNAYQLLGRPAAVTLYYEKTLGKIGIEKADARARGSIALVPKHFGAYAIYAMGFCRRNLIEVVGTHAFRQPEINHNGILILDLNETERVGGWVTKATAEKYRTRLNQERIRSDHAETKDP